MNEKHLKILRNLARSLAPIWIGFAIYALPVRAVESQPLDRQSCVDVLSPATVFELAGPDGRKYRFRTEGRSPAERRFKLEAQFYEDAAPEDLVTVEWLYHPFYALSGHNSLRIGNSIYEFTHEGGWRIRESGRDNARAFLYNNPLFKRVYERYKGKGMPPFSVGIPLQIPKWKVAELDRWIRQYPQEGGKPFSFLFNNCSHCVIGAFAQTGIGNIKGSKFENFSSLLTTRTVLTQQEISHGDAVLYILPGFEAGKMDLASLVPASIYGHGTISELKRDLKVTADGVIEKITKKSRKLEEKRPDFSDTPAVPSGTFRGTPLSTLRPSLKVLPESDVLARTLSPRKGSILLGNFISDKSLWVADLPAHPPESMSLLVQVNQDTGKIQHVQILFRYSEDNPILLLEPMDLASKTGAPPRPIFSTLFDATAWLPKGQEGLFNVQDAQAGRYGLQHRMREAEPVLELELSRGRDLFEYPIHSNEEQRAAVLRTIIERNNEVNRGMMYDYCKQHCGTEVLAAFDALDPPQSWTESLKRKVFSFFGRNLGRTVDVMNYRGLVDVRSAKRFFRASEKGTYLLKDGVNTLPISFGLELEFELRRAPQLTRYYRRFDISEKKWLEMSEKDRVKSLEETDPRRSFVRGVLTLFKRNKLVRISGGPDFLPEFLVIENHGTYEVNGVIADTIEELRRARSKIEDLFGRGSLQVHVAFPRSPVSGATGYMVYKTDESVILHLENSYARYQKDPTKTPARRLVYWALGPMSETNRAFYLKNEQIANQGRKLEATKRRRLITGPVLRDEPYPEGYLGFELRQDAENAPDLINEAEWLGERLKNGTLGEFQAFEATEQVSLELIPKFLSRHAISGQHTAESWVVFFKTIGKNIEDTFPYRIAGGSRGSERLLIPLRNWENYPALARLDPVLRNEVIRDLGAATADFTRSIDDLMDSSGDISDKVLKVRIAVAKWADSARLSRIFIQK